MNRSSALFKEAQDFMPGGVNSPVRAFNGVGGTPIFFERGEGAYLFDADGQRYLDFATGIAVNALGHCHPHLVNAVREQAGKLWHTSNMYQIPGQQKLAQRLVDATFADSVFFANSGAEAVECALKMARKY